MSKRNKEYMQRRQREAITGRGKKESCQDGNARERAVRHARGRQNGDTTRTAARFFRFFLSIY